MKIRISSGIVPFSVHRGRLVFLLGREAPYETGESLWCGFEGSGDKGETSDVNVAARECDEESMSCVFMDTREDLSTALAKGEYCVRSDYTVTNRSNTQEQHCTLYAKYIPYDPFVEVRFRETRKRVLQIHNRYNKLLQTYMSPLLQHTKSIQDININSSNKRIWGVDEYCRPTPNGYEIRWSDTSGVEERMLLPYDKVTKVVQRDMQLWFEHMYALISDVQRGIDANTLGGAVELIRDASDSVIRIHFRPERMEKTTITWWSYQRLEEAFKWRRSRRMFRGRFVHMMAAILHIIDKSGAIDITDQGFNSQNHNYTITDRLTRLAGKWPRTKYATSPASSPTKGTQCESS